MLQQLMADATYYDDPYYSSSYSSSGSGDVPTVFWVFLGVFLLIALVLSVLTIIGKWQTFVKAGKPGWAAIVPFYEYYVTVELSGSPMWFFWLYLAVSLVSWIPLIGLLSLPASLVLIVTSILLSINVAKSFGKDTGFGVLLAFLPFVGYLILGNDKKVRYLGPAGPEAAQHPVAGAPVQPQPSTPTTVDSTPPVEIPHHHTAATHDHSAGEGDHTSDSSSSDNTSDGGSSDNAAH